jgi:hypothetical protein
MAQDASEADAKRAASREEREFAFKIIERELGKAGDSSSRAEVLLFLAKAGILNSLNRPELETMALSEIEKAGKKPSDVGIPPTLGRPDGQTVPFASVPFDRLVVLHQRIDGRWRLKLDDCSELHVVEDEKTIATRLGSLSFVRLDWAGMSLWAREGAINLARSIHGPGSERGVLAINAEPCRPTFYFDGTEKPAFDALMKSLAAVARK